MYTLTPVWTPRKNPFDLVADPFVQGEGLPFSQVLPAEAIEGAFAHDHALFAQQDIFSTQVVLWAFMAQVLRDGKGAACASAVADRPNAGGACAAGC